MSKKIVVIGNALVVTDTVLTKDVIDTPTKNVYYDIDELEKNSNIRFVHLSVSDSINQRFPTIPLADAINTSNAAFTIASFKAFARASLGN